MSVLGSQRAPSWVTRTAVTTCRGNSGVAAAWWEAVDWLCRDIALLALRPGGPPDAVRGVGPGVVVLPEAAGQRPTLTAGNTAVRLLRGRCRRRTVCSAHCFVPKLCSGACSAYRPVLPSVALCCSVLRCVLRRLLFQPSAFALGQAAPDAESLVVGEGVLEAFGADFAGEADLLGLAGGAALLGKEGLGVGLGAKSTLLPSELFVRLLDQQFLKQLGHVRPSLCLCVPVVVPLLIAT